MKTADPGMALHGVKIMLHHFVDGRLRVYHRERLLAFTDYGTYPVPDPAEDEKTIDARVDAVIPAQQRLAHQAIAEAV